jgi:hypothetical protein
VVEASLRVFGSAQKPKYFLPLDLIRLLRPVPTGALVLLVVVEERVVKVVGVVVTIPVVLEVVVVRAVVVAVPGRHWA